MLDLEKMEDDDDIITLQSEDGKEIDFVVIAGIAHKGKFYELLQPVELLEGMNEDECLIFEVERQADNTDKFIIVMDDEIIKAVFEEYNRLLDESSSKDLEN